MTSSLVSISICVILPVSIVLINSLAKINSENKRAKIIIKAIEANKDVDTGKLIESLQKPQKSALETRNTRLLRGCIFSLIGLALFIGGLVSHFNGYAFSAFSVSIPVMLGGASVAIGISYLIVYFVTREHVSSDETK